MNKYALLIAFAVSPIFFAIPLDDQKPGNANGDVISTRRKYGRNEARL